MNLLSPTRHWPSVPIGAVRPAGTTWGAIETARGEYNWQGLDTWVAAAEAHGVEFDYVFLNTPQWASTRPTEHCNRGNIGCAAPPNTRDWEDFVTAVATRYKGRIADYELWNEPNAPGFWSGTPTQMVDLASRAYRIIKAIDPHATILNPASASPGWPLPHDVWLDKYLQAGGGRYLDVFAWHGYSGNENKPPYPPEELLQQIDLLHGVLRRHDLDGLAIWNTEGGFEKDVDSPDEQQQAAFLVRWYLLQFTHGVARTYWYQWDNPSHGTLWREETGLTPAGAALRQVYGWLNGVTASTPCSSRDRTVWVCDLSKGNRRFRAVWNTSGTSPYKNAGAFVSFVGQEQHRRSVVDGTVMIGPYPTLLEEK